MLYHGIMVNEWSCIFPESFPQLSNRSCPGCPHPTDSVMRTDVYFGTTLYVFEDGKIIYSGLARQCSMGLTGSNVQCPSHLFQYLLDGCVYIKCKNIIVPL